MPPNIVSAVIALDSASLFLLSRSALMSVMIFGQFRQSFPSAHLNNVFATRQRHQSSSASRFTAGAFGFLTFTQCGERARIWDSWRLEKSPGSVTPGLSFL